MEPQSCPQCGEQLMSQRCKLQCPKCGYTEDCSDAGLIDYDALEHKPKRHPRPTREDKSAPAPGRYLVTKR